MTLKGFWHSQFWITLNFIIKTNFFVEFKTWTLTFQIGYYQGRFNGLRWLLDEIQGYFTTFKFKVEFYGIR